MIQVDFDIPKIEMIRRKATTLLHKLRLLDKCYLVYQLQFYDPENPRKMSYRKKYRKEGVVFTSESISFARYEILPSAMPRNIVLRLILENTQKV